MYIKLYKHLHFDGQCALMCSNVCKQFALCVNNNKPHNTLDTFAKYNRTPVKDMTIKLGPSTNHVYN